MPKTMLIALWMRDTFLKQGRGKTNRLARLKAAVEKTAEIRKGVVTRQHWAKPEVIFIAPEYLFGRPTGVDWRDPAHHQSLARGANPRDPKRDRHLDEEDKDYIKRELIALSAKHREFLIVPGTIAWSVRVKDHPRLLQVAKHRVRLQPPGYVAGPSPADKLARLVSFTSLDDRKAGRAAPHLTKPEEKRLNNARLCLNTAFVLYGGDIKFVYSKQGDFYEVLAPCQTQIAYEVAIPGDKCGVFEIEGNWYGIEICYDHFCGVLHQVPLQTPPLIHLITSASVDVDPSHCVVAPGGYVANAAADAENIYRTGLWHSDPVTRVLKRVESPSWPGIRLPRLGQRPPNLPQSQPWPPVSYKAYNDVAGSPLWVYRVDVPEAPNAP
jgi:predicted amidohydrolase